jgi:hypothetical protein
MASKHFESLKNGTNEQKAWFERYYKDAYQRLNSDDPDTSKRGEDELIQLYLLDQANGRVEGLDPPSKKEIVGLTAVEQWQRGQSPLPSPLQRVGGAIIEVGIDYALHIPGGVSSDSKFGRTVRAFLEGLDDFDFQNNRWDEILVRLFTTALDVVEADSTILADDNEKQQLLAAIVRGVSRDVDGRLKKLPAVGDLDAEERIKVASQVVLRSVLRGAGTTILNNPSALGLAREGRISMVEAVGGQMLSLLLDDTGDGQAYSLKGALNRSISTQSFDRLVATFLKTGVAHPTFFGIDEPEVEQWLTNILSGLHMRFSRGKSFIDPDLFNDLTILMIEHAMNDLPSLLKIRDDPGGMKTSLALEIMANVYDAITIDGADGEPKRWQFDLSKQDVIQLFASALDSITNRPELISTDRDEQTVLVAGLRLGIDLLRGQGEGRLKALIRNGRLEQTLAAALQSGIIEELSGYDIPAISAVIKKIIVASTANGRIGLERVLQEDVLTDILSAVAKSGVLPKLLGGTPDEQNKLHAVLQTLVDELKGGRTRTVSAMSYDLKKAA